MFRIKGLGLRVWDGESNRKQKQQSCGNWANKGAHRDYLKELPTTFVGLLEVPYTLITHRSDSGVVGSAFLVLSKLGTPMSHNSRKYPPPPPPPPITNLLRSPDPPTA